MKKNNGISSSGSGGVSAGTASIGSMPLIATSSAPERSSYHNSSTTIASSNASSMMSQDRKCDSCGYRVAINECQ